MKNQVFRNWAGIIVLAAAGWTLPSAGQVTVNVTSPTNNSKVSSPVHYVASATSPQCAQGIAAMRIYIAPHTSAYNVMTNTIDTSLALAPGNYNTVVEAWDNCGGVGKVTVHITVSATGLQPAKFLYVADDSNDEVWGFSVNPSTGALSPTSQGAVITNSSYRLAADPGGFRLYVTNAGPDPFSLLYAYFIDRSSGALTPTPGSPYAVTRTTGAVAVHPSGKFVFVGTLSFLGDDGILVFKVNPDGSLTAVNTTPVPTKAPVSVIAVDRFGKYIYATSYSGDSLDGFSVDSNTGALTPVPGSPFTISTPGCTSTGASEMTFFWGHLLYTSDMNASEISGFSTMRANGALNPVPGSPFADHGACPNGDAAPNGIAIEPTGRFLYVLNESLFNISIYSINAGNGTLTYLKDTPPYGSSPFYGQLRPDPSGKFLYTRVTGANGDELVGFAINQTTGDLKPIAGFPFPIGANTFAFDIAVTP